MTNQGGVTTDQEGGLCRDGGRGMFVRNKGGGGGLGRVGVGHFCSNFPKN